jgi:hypothetical protein
MDKLCCKSASKDEGNKELIYLVLDDPCKKFGKPRHHKANLNKTTNLTGQKNTDIQRARQMG